MPNVSKTEGAAASRMTWTKIIKHVREAKQCDEREARRQIGNAIAARKLRVWWEDQREIPFGSSPFQVQVTVPPRDAAYWLTCEIDPIDPDRVLEPPPHDPDLVNKRTAARLDKKRRFRKPLFPRDQVLMLWTVESRPDTVASLDSRRRGPKPERLNKIKDEMRRELSSGALTKKALGELTEEAMRSRYDVSRDTCRRARREVLSESEFVDNSPDGNSDK